MLINLSSDLVTYAHAGSIQLLERNTLEKTLPLLLETTLNQSDLPLSPLVINGPGWFTNLRIGCLSLTMRNMLHQYPIQRLTIDKITLYQWFYDHHQIPYLGVIFIGQTKNYRLVDLHAHTQSLITQSDIVHLTGVYFVDEMFGKDHEHPYGVCRTREDDQLTMTYRNMMFVEYVHRLPTTIHTHITPNYMIHPQTTP